MSYTAASSVALVSPNWSASAVGGDAGKVASGGKSKIVKKAKTKKATTEKTTTEKTKKTTQTLADQNGIYAAEKFSGSFSISHVLNLLVESEYVVPFHCHTI